MKQQKHNHFTKFKFIATCLLMLVLSAYHSQSQTTITIGAGTSIVTSSNGATGDGGPMYRSTATSNFVYSRYHYLYTAAELASAGITSGTLITSLAWNKGLAAGTNSTCTFQIWLKNSSLTSVGAGGQNWATLIGASTQVFNSNTFTVPVPAGYLLVPITPFTYTGGALEISTNFDISNGVSPWTTAGFAFAKDPSTNTTLSYVGSAAPGATLPNLRTVRPQIQITFISASPCIDPPTAGTAITNASNVCTGGAATLNLNGQSTGSGQTYQWESSPTSGSGFTSIGVSSTSPILNINPTSSLYYRCQVTCGASTLPSTEVFVNVPTAFPGGFYTIDNTLSTGGGNFASFADAVSAMACGISGPVVFDLAPGTGPYNEQVTIPQIGGASATNTITFNGYNETLTFNATGSSYHTLGLNGADYIRVNDLNIVGTNATNALVGHLWNNADNNIFTNCTFTAPANGTSTTQVPFSCSGTEISGTASGTSGSNNELIGCTMNSGYYNTCFVGNSGAGLAATGNKVINCNLRDQYFYASYNLYQNGIIISGNTFERANRTTLSTYYGVYLSTGVSNALVEKNKIRNTWGAIPTSTGTQYSIYDLAAASAGNENRIENNLISDINFNGVLYGIYITSNYKKVYHNTVSFNQASSTGTTTYGIYVSGATGVDVQNNNISITRGGTGAKNCLYFTVAGVSSNYNNVYINTLSSGTNGVGFYVSNFASLANWQTANAGVWDQQSVSADPGFANTAIYDYAPTNVLLDNVGNNLGVATDINSASRTTTPDLGCYEFAVSLLDVGAVSLVSPNSTGCYSATENIEISIKNYGAATIDFAVNPVTVVCDITGAVSTTLTDNALGTLAPGATMVVTLSPSLNMTSNGTYTFNAYTTLTGDGSALNDAFASPTDRVVGPIAGVISSSLPTICVSGAPTLTLTGNYGGSIQWQESTVSASGPWTNVGTGTNSYSPGTVTQTSYYQVEVSCNGNTSLSNTLTIAVNNPQLLSTTPGSRCGIGTVVLGANVGAGNSANWYANATGGLPLATNTTSFVTPIISATTDYYVAPNSGGGLVANVGLTNANTTATSGAGTTNFGLVFDVLAPFTLNSVKIYPVSASSASGTVTIDVIDGTGAVMHTATFSVVGGPAGSGVNQTLNLNFNLLPGTNYKLRPGSFTGITGLMFEPSASAPGGNYGYPMTIPGVVNILTSTLTAAPANTVRNDLYYYFYDWSVSSGCEGPRTLVTASVNTAPSVTATIADPTLCPGGSTTISASSTNDPDYTYTWTSSIGGFTASGAGPHTVSPTNVTTYTVNAVDNTSGPFAGCASQATVSVVTAPTLSAGTVTASISNICVSGTTALSVSGAQGGSLQWQESTVSASGPWTNVGSGAITYSPGIVTQTTYYQVEVTCQTTSIQSNVVTVTVNNPQILTTTPGSRCGFGTVSLDATADPGSSIRWYNSASGGSVLFTGTPFVTPSIATTTTFYAEAGIGSGGADSVSAPVGTTSGVYHHMFVMNTPTGMTLNEIGIKGNQAAGTLTSWEVYYRPNNYQLTPGANTSSTGWILLSSATNIPSAGNGATDYTYIGLGLGLVIPPGASYSFYIAPATGTTHPYNTTALGTTAAGGTSSATLIGGNRGSALFNCTTSGGLPNVRLKYTLGCLGTRTPVLATVNTPPSISVSPTSSTVCSGQSLTLSVSSSNDPDYTYTWNPGGLTGASVIVNPLVSTIYTVTALDNTAGPNAGCGNVETVGVIVNPILVSLNPTISPTSVCVGANANLIANAIAPGYSMNAASTTAFIDISTSGTDIPSLGDDTEHNISIPSFTFNGTVYTTARVGVNGVIVLGSTTLDVPTTNAALPATTITAGNVFLAPYWDDLDIQTGLTIKTQTIGNVHIIQYSNAAHNLFTTGGITFQVQLDLLSGTVTYVYSDVTFGDVLYDAGVNATVGIQMSSTSALQYSFNTASLVAGQAITFTPNAATVSWSGPNGFNSALPNPVLSSVTNLESGIYTVTATGSNGCTTSSTVNLVVNTPTSSTTSQSIPCAGSYVWNGNTYTASGIYTFTTTGSSGCDSIASLDLTVLPCNTTLNLTAFIEGYWDGTSAMLPVLLNQGQPNTATECDHITVELISPATVAGGAPYTPDYTTTAMLNTNGTASAVFTSAISGNYYIVIKHRNALQTWSANAMSFPSTTSYDFSSAASQAYGSNQAEIATGVWALFSGDLVVDENMDLLDLGLVEADISAFSFGYLATDINGDGNVDLLDSPVLETNISNFVFSAHP